MAKKSGKKSAARNSVAQKDTAPNKKEGRLAKAQARAQKMQNNRNKPKQKREKGRLKEYFRGVKLEMKKVVWPTRQELGSFTVVVLCVCAAFALVFWAIDSGVLAGIKLIAPKL